MASKRTNNGRGSIAAFMADEAATLVAGTDGTAPQQTDSALGNQVESTSASGNQRGNADARVFGRFSTGQANDDLEEFGLKDADGDLTERHTVAELTKTSSFELEVTITATVNNT